MIGKKKLSEIRASLLETCGASGEDVIKSLDERVRKRERRQPPNRVEIETLKLIRDGLREKPKTAKGTYPLSEAPSPVKAKQLKELHIKLDLPPAPQA